MTVNQWGAWLKSLFLQNGIWKAVSLAVALLVYFSIRSEISHVRTVTFPVEVEQDGRAEGGLGGAVVESVVPPVVRVTLRGSYEEVTQLAEKDMRCLIRPRQKKGELMDAVPVKIRNSNLRGIRRVQVVKIEPGRVDVKFDVPMSIRLAVAPPETKGHARGRVELSRGLTNAVVKGSRRLLSPLDRSKVLIQPDPVDVEGRTQTFTARVKLNPPGDDPNAKVDPPEMAVTVKVISEKSTAKIEHIPVKVLQPAGSAAVWKVDPEYVDVEVTGRSEIVAGIAFGELIAAVNGNIPVVEGALTNDAPVSVHVRQGLAVDDAKPFPPTVKLIAVEPAPEPEPEPAKTPAPAAAPAPAPSPVSPSPAPAPSPVSPSAAPTPAPEPSAVSPTPAPSAVSPTPAPAPAGRPQSA